MKSKKKKSTNKEYLTNNNHKNIVNTTLKKCSVNPITGFYRDGYCKTGKPDLGTHTICAEMDSKFMDYTKKKGNDLYSVVKPGQKWCLCEYRWNQAYLDGVAPKIFPKSTNIKTNKSITKNIVTHLQKYN